MRNLLLKIQYDGSLYHGWARQPGLRTVCGRMEEVLSEYFSVPVELAGASRTDAGVHANGQAATLLTELGVPTDKVPMVFNTALADDRTECLSDIRVLDAREMPEGFHARFDSKGKRYIYRIRNSETPDIFLKRYRWQITRPLDIDAMRAACPYVEGEHDFACFRSSGSQEGSTVREVYSLDVKRLEDDPSEILITIEGSAFLYNMVRIITGTLVETGLGKRKPEDMEQIIASKDRSNAGIIAPAGGLWLDEVFYQER
ncbi:MAG: tRNA pseudouridine(38-40) synthase TruA [Clostridia bacterium]|nr:tRNA pseudouridine(38-40) synthase TruA [Clostridia bacterium]